MRIKIQLLGDGHWPVPVLQRDKNTDFFWKKWSRWFWMLVRL